MTVTEELEDLPEPDCPHGYPLEQLEEEMSSEQFHKFLRWVYGQTVLICNGEVYDHDIKKYGRSDCFDSPHGSVAYVWDVAQFMRGVETVYD